jgi:cytochrome oxidase Cu insertion factor (SCO1/SenC/PrrC family)
MTASPAKARRGRLQLLLLAALFASPMLLAYVLFYSDWRPERSANYGELVQPPRLVADVALTDLQGQRFALRSLRGKWLYVHFGSAQCAGACADALYKTRQVIIAQEKNYERVQRLFVVTDGEATDPTLAALLKEHPGLRVARPDAETLRALAREFSLPVGSPLENRDRVYLLDPLGNLMLSYPADANPNGMRKDLARLLRVSRVG